jgi:hypothetical protein
MQRMAGGGGALEQRPFPLVVIVSSSNDMPTTLDEVMVIDFFEWSQAHPAGAASVTPFPYPWPAR